MSVVILRGEQVERLRAAVATCLYRDWLFAVTAESGTGTLSLLVGRPAIGEILYTHHPIPPRILSNDSGDEFAGLSGFVEGVAIELTLRDLRHQLVVGGKSVYEREQEIVANFIRQLPSYSADTASVAVSRDVLGGDELLRDACPCVVFRTSALCACPNPFVCGCDVPVVRGAEVA